MSTDPQAAASVPSLVDSLQAYVNELPPEDRPDALHQVFYGFYTRVAIIDRATHELAARAKDDGDALKDLPPSLAEALRDNALFVGQELFASRVRAMAAMGYISTCLAESLHGEEPPRPFTLTRAVAFDQDSGVLRTYELSRPGEHPELPYDARSYDPRAA
jgi:hypothetical protein